MDEFAIEVLRPPGYFVDEGEEFCLWYPVGRILINGRDLLERLREFELSQGVSPVIAGAYSQPPAGWFGYPNNWFHTRGNELWGDKRCIFFCTCGQDGCRDLLMRITTRGDTVTWSEFADSHGSSADYDRFGPFVFDRRQYARAIYAAGEAASRR